MKIGFALICNDPYTNNECTVILLVRSHAISTFFEHHHNDSVVKGFACQNYTFYVRFSRAIDGGFLFLLLQTLFLFTCFRFLITLKIYEHF